MLIKADFTGGIGGRLAALSVERGATDVVCESGGWWGIMDTMLPSDRHEEIRTGFKELVALLSNGGPEVLSEEVASRIFAGHFFLVLAHKTTGTLWVARDTAGAKSGYAAWNGQQLFVGSCMQDVAACLPHAQPSMEATRQLMALDFLFDGQSYYDDVAEIPMGNTLRISGPDGIAQHHRPLALPGDENRLNPAQNCAALRRQIIEAHARRAGASNVVLLSGGIDSAAMLCSLQEVAGQGRVRAKTFRVKGTREDETGYALEFARYLGVECELREIDPDDESLFEDFERDVLRMNNPYMGRWIFGQFVAGSGDVYFAGQDTRLHTPDINGVDKIAFSLLGLQKTPLVQDAAAALAGAADVLGQAAMRISDQRWVRGLRRAGLTLDLDRYLPRYFFKLLPEKFEKHGFPPAVIAHVRDRLSVDWRSARSRRDLYNRIVEMKWGEQYTDDMRYLQDVARINGTHIALPFYDMNLARFSAQLPFDQSTMFIIGNDKFSKRRKKINKYLLREAFRSQLNDGQYFRKKAVSRSQYLMFSGILGKKIKSILQSSLKNDRIWLDNIGVTESVERFVGLSDFRPEDEEFLTKIYYLATNYILKSQGAMFARRPAWRSVQIDSPTSDMRR